MSLAAAVKPAVDIGHGGWYFCARRSQSETANWGAVAITAEEIEQAKKTLPFGWGRFGKALDQLAELSEPDESLLAPCVGLNPEYQYKPKFVPGTVLGAGHALNELKKSINVVLACTNQRLILISTGGGGAPREHVSVQYEGLEIVSRDKKEFVLGLPEGQVRIRGAAKQQVPAFLQALESRARPAAESSQP